MPGQAISVFYPDLLKCNLYKTKHRLAVLHKNMHKSHLTWKKTRQIITLMWEVVPLKFPQPLPCLLEIQKLVPATPAIYGAVSFCKESLTNLNLQ